MTYTGLELFMENLRQLSYSNNNPLINNNPYILTQRPQIEMLYRDLSSVIRILFVEIANDLNELEEVRNLKKEFKDVVREAHNIVGRFVYFVNASRFTFTKCSLNLKNVMRSINSINDKFMTIHDNLKAQPPVAAGTSSTKISLITNVLEEQLVVGLDGVVKLIKDKLVEEQEQLDVISIVGMGGLGKTTLATIVFNDPYVVYHFEIRAWVTVSQTYERRDLLVQILASIGTELDIVQASYGVLVDMLHKRLMNMRYLIVIDDIWSNKAWDDLNIYFKNNYTQSRILLTTRLKEVALYARPNGFIHYLAYLSEEESWVLLSKKVFQGDNCPDWLIKPGKLIAKNCHGLPLAVVVIAGILAKEEVSKDSWEKNCSKGEFLHYH